MSKHHPDLVLCRKQPGVTVGRLCERCEGKCVVCDSLVRATAVARVCDECNYGAAAGKCVICGGIGVADAAYCYECTVLERDRDGCPKVGTSRVALLLAAPMLLWPIPSAFSARACLNLTKDVNFLLPRLSCSRSRSEPRHVQDGLVLREEKVYEVAHHIYGALALKWLRCCAHNGPLFSLFFR